MRKSVNAYMCFTSPHAEKIKLLITDILSNMEREKVSSVSHPNI